MRSDLETRFHHKMRGLYDRSVKECNYRPTYFLQMVVEHGGFETARRLLHARKVSDGFTTLWENGRLDLSVEAVVLQEPWSDLFTDEELAIAEKRLRDLGQAQA